MASRVVAASGRTARDRGSLSLYSMEIMQSGSWAATSAIPDISASNRAGIVTLKGVVIAVLPQPQRHHRPTHHPRRVGAALGQVNRLAPHNLIRVGKSAAFDRWVGVVPHRRAAIGQTTLPGHLACGNRLGDVIGIVQIQLGQAHDRGSTLHQLAQAGLAVLVRPVVRRPRRERVDPGGKAISKSVIPPKLHDSSLSCEVERPIFYSSFFGVDGAAGGDMCLTFGPERSGTFASARKPMSEQPPGNLGCLEP